MPLIVYDKHFACTRGNQITLAKLWNDFKCLGLSEILEQAVYERWCIGTVI